MTARCIPGWRIGVLVVSVVALSRVVTAQELSESKADGTRSVPATKEALPPPSAEMLAPARPAIEKGLKFLATRQQEDGAFSNSGYGRNAAVAALAGMAWLANGSTPGRGPYGEEVERITDYLLDHCEENGFISVEGATSHGPMYEHGFATLFLAEVYGMSPRDDLRDKLTRAIDLIVRTQNSEGGWRYQPRREDADLSVTICQVMALRAARNAGLRVPNETIDQCIDYVKKSQNADGGFRYMLQAGGESAVSAVGGGRRRACTAPASTRAAKWSAGLRTSISICRGRAVSAHNRKTATSSTVITTPFRPCGRQMANAGHVGTRQFAICSSAASSPTAPGPTP